MVVTEEQSLTMQCRSIEGGQAVVEARVPGAIAVQQASQQQLRTIIANCVGSKCMAWRWWDDARVPSEERRGFCGLAGTPLYEVEPPKSTVEH